MRDVIRGLARAAPRLPGRDDRGVVGVLIGMLIGTVLLGLGALVIDVGQLYQERAELQNGADAAALAVAKSCAVGTCTASSALSTAVIYAGKNAKDGVAAVPQVCVSTLGVCPTSSGAMTDCPSVAPVGGSGYVRVHTATATSGGGTVIAPVFAKALLGNDSYTGTQVLACAQASWGGPSSANTVAFAISACSWDSWTTKGANFAPAPPAVPSSTFDHQLNLNKLNNGTNCTGEPSGSDGAGAFGWALDQTGTCGIFTNSVTFPADTGASAGSTCQTALSSAWASRKAIFLPVYTTDTGTGSNTVLALKGFAAFVVTGYSLPGFSASDWLKSANNSCSFKCIDGYFTKALIPGADGEGGTYLGAASVGLTG